MLVLVEVAEEILLSVDLSIVVVVVVLVDVVPGVGLVVVLVLVLVVVVVAKSNSFIVCNYRMILLEREIFILGIASFFFHENSDRYSTMSPKLPSSADMHCATHLLLNMSL